MEFKQTELLKSLYKAFNGRDIPAAVSMMTADVTWPRAFKGGFICGHDAIRDYWTEQWSEINPNVEPVGFAEDGADAIAVDVHQVVRDLQGAVLDDSRVCHRFTFKDGLVSGMSLKDKV